LSNSGVVNPVQNSVQVIIDAELEGDEWYLLADRRTIKAGYLAGTGRVPILKMVDNTLSRTEYEGVFDFTVSPADYRGMQKGK